MRTEKRTTTTMTTQVEHGFTKGVEMSVKLAAPGEVVCCMLLLFRITRQYYFPAIRPLKFRLRCLSCQNYKEAGNGGSTMILDISMDVQSFLGPLDSQNRAIFRGRRNFYQKDPFPRVPTSLSRDPAVCQSGIRGERRLSSRVHVDPVDGANVRGGADVGRRVGDPRERGSRGRGVVGCRRAETGGRLQDRHADQRDGLRQFHGAARQQLDRQDDK